MARKTAPHYTLNNFKLPLISTLFKQILQILTLIVIASQKYNKITSSKFAFQCGEIFCNV